MKKKVLIMVSILLLVISNFAFATGGLEQSIFVTGLTKLFTDAGRVIAIISPIVAGVMVGYFFVRRGAADEMDHKKWSNRISVAIVSGIAGTLGGAIISVLASYFK